MQKGKVYRNKIFAGLLIKISNKEYIKRANPPPNIIGYINNFNATPIIVLKKSIIICNPFFYNKSSKVYLSLIYFFKFFSSVSKSFFIIFKWSFKFTLASNVDKSIFLYSEI